MATWMEKKNGWSVAFLIIILCSPACREPILLLQLCGAAVLGILLYNVFCLLARQSSKLGGHFASLSLFHLRKAKEVVESSRYFLYLFLRWLLPHNALPSNLIGALILLAGLLSPPDPTKGWEVFCCPYIHIERTTIVSPPLLCLWIWPTHKPRPRCKLCLR